MARLMQVLLGALWALTASSSLLTNDPNLKLVTTAIVSRHSIKVPSNFSTQPLVGCQELPRNIWDPPQSGYLTHGGFQLALAQGRYLKHRYSSLFASSCQQTAVWALADPEERDEWTAQGLVNGIYEGCAQKPTPVSTPPDDVHLIFSEGQDGNMFPGCERASEAQVLGMVGGNVTDFFHSNLKTQLQAISTNAGCDLLSVPTTWKGGYWTTFVGGIQLAAKYADSWLTAALSGNTVAPQGTPLTLAQVLDMYKVTSALFNLYRNPFNLNNFGSENIANVVAALDQVVNGTASQLNDPFLPKLENKVLLYVAHDLQLAFERHLLDLHWSSAGWLYNQPTFDGQLVHDLFQDPTSGEFFVKLGFVSNSPQGMLATQAQNSSAGVSWVPISIPGCNSSSTDPYMCSWRVFKQLVSSRLSTRCVSSSMRSFMDGVAASSHPATITDNSSSSSSSSNKWPIVLLVFGFTALLVALALAIWTCRRHLDQKGDGYAKVNEHMANLM